jgi:hypothetical protein
MDSYVHNFVNYLLYFGLIHPNLISSFENQYNILVTGLNNNNNIRFKNENKFITKSKSVSNIKLINNKDEMIFQALNNYIMGLTSNQIKIISKNILGKFNQYIGNIRNKFLNNLVNIYSKQKLNQYIEKWKKIDFVKIENTNLNNNNIIEKKKDIKTNDNTYFKKISNEIRNKISNFKRDYSNPKKKYPESDYIQKLSKTIFNHNQLEQTILYECFIDYSQNRIKKSIIKCITNKNLYKYLKLEFEINCQSKEKDIIDYFKNIFTDGYFYLRKSENKFELSGKINDFSILYPKYFQNLSFIKFLGIITIRKYIYQFYEELAHEYQNPNIITDNVRIEMNDEIISLLNNNYNILIFLRDYYNTKCNK